MERRPLASYAPPRLLALASLGLYAGPACGGPGYVVMDHGPPVRDSAGPAVVVDQREIDFGEVDPAVWEEIVQAVHICNAGDEVVLLLDVALDPEDPHFRVGQGQRAELTPADCTTVNVTFRPEAGVASATKLRIESDDPVAPEVSVPVRGAGTDPT